MSQPAARQGDSTMHGGLVSIGFPQVLIGGMPAARTGDMHTCPLATPGTPPVPHIGGPITMGSATVLIGNQPAARLGDVASCVGPPDSIAVGCPTVFIG
ncbi:MAG: PAAR domain-containing protein [Chloroflexi bacterium]|nr:PAAR domain-containing protein [Chloroflexota bacterium]